MQIFNQRSFHNGQIDIHVFSFRLCVFVFNLTCAFLFQIKLDLMKLLDSGIVKCCKEDKVKIGLF